MNRQNPVSRQTLRTPGLSALRGLLPLALIILGISGCVYYNTFYNARKNFNEAENARLKSISSGAATTRVNTSKYQKAIEKASVVLEKHPNSKYYDDALYMIGVSYYWIKDYLKSQRKFRELLANFEDSEYATMSKLYLAQCKLQLDERPEAITIFQSLLETVDDEDIKVEATFAIADFYFEQTEYDTSQIYYQILLDSLSASEDDRRRSLLRIADGNFAKFDIPAAKKAYLDALDMDPNPDEEFLALFQAGKCAYLMQDIEGGMDLFRQLAEDERFYDSIGVVRLEIARGYEMDDDLILAEEEYEAISVESQRKKAEGAALYNLGLIYQFDYVDLNKALEYYDKANALGRSLNPYYDESVKRAADIGKLANYENRLSKDSTTTLDQLDEASLAQIKLGELYLFELNQTDSALVAFRYAVDSFPDTYYAPRAMISLAVAHRDFKEDTLAFDSLISRALAKYPKSDYYPTALEARGLLGTAADSGYPASYFDIAERWLLDESNLDSALHYYQYIVDSFPRSNLAAKARFTTIWLEDQSQQSGDDSTIIFAYNDLAELYPDDEYGKLAGSIVSYIPSAAPVEVEQDIEQETETLADSLDPDTAAFDPFTDPSGIDTTLSPELRHYIGADGRVLRNAPSNPAQYQILELIYPSTAGGMPDFFDLYYQVKIDFDGRVMDFILKNPTQYPELNSVYNEQVDNFVFDVGRFGPDGIGNGWFVYKYRITKPEYLR